VAVAVVALAFTAGIVVGAVLAFAAIPHPDTVMSRDGDTYAEQIKRNVDALRRSRAWWESFGQRHRPSQRLVDRSTATAE